MIVNITWCKKDDIPIINETGSIENSSDYLSTDARPVFLEENKLIKESIQND
jgi:hypothetical protein